MLKSIVISSEESSCRLIKDAISSYCPNIDFVCQSGSCKSGISAINEYDPDLVLLDIRQTDGSGFEIMDYFNPPEFKVIVFSSHPEYAIKAIKYNAIDYLLKPLKEEEIAQAIKKAEDVIRYEEKLQAKALGSSLGALSSTQRLLLKSSDQVHLVNVSDIIHIEASGNYSTFFMLDGKRILISKSSREFEEALVDQGFHRIHKSHIVNVNRMDYFDKVDGGYLVMCNGDRVPVASRKRDMLMELFDSLT